MKRIVLYLAFLLTSVQPMLAQEGSLLKDINVTASNSGLRIYESVVVGNMIYMIADDSFQQKGLWKSDGTAQGTVLLKEFKGLKRVQELTSSNGLIYLTAYEGYYDINTYLWKSDGTPEGTVSFQRVRDYSVDLDRPLLLDINGTLYYNGPAGLMKTDGTAQGTVLVKSLDSDYKIGHMVNVNGKLFLTISDRYNSIHNVYKSDGTTAGTVALTNFSGDSQVPVLVVADSNVYFRNYPYEEKGGIYKVSDTSPVTFVKGFEGGVFNLTAVGSSVYFTASDAPNGNELWKTDGTAAGTVLVKNINPGAASSDPSLLRAANGQLYFVATNGINGKELWKSGGTASTTTLVKDIRPGSRSSAIKELTTVGSKVAFTANDGSGEKLWQSNGDVNGTKVLANVTASRLLDANGTLYFNGNAGPGLELFKSTMVTGGTSAISDIARPGSIPGSFTQVNKVSYFAADDGIHGRELWKTDGSTAGTMLVSDIQIGVNSSNPEQITDVNGTAFFVTGSGSQVHSLWKTGGTAATTFKVKDFTKADNFRGLIHVNGTLFFGMVNKSDSMQLWKSDGSTAGTQLIKTFPQTETFSPVTLNGQVYFGAYDGINSVDLWKSNGTAEGTVLVKDVAVSMGKSLYESLVVAGNLMYYVITDRVPNVERRNLLVKTDGTNQGTTIVKNIYPNDGNSFLTKLVAVNDMVFFIGFANDIFDDIPGEVLWRSDGTEQGTIPLREFSMYDYYDLYTHNMTALNGILYFVPRGPGYPSEGYPTGDQLWRSDGTVEGTRVVKQIGNEKIDFLIKHTAVVGKTLYFTTTDGTSGIELWKTDGTEQTTELAYELTPNGSTLFYELAALNNQLLISADNGKYGAELFKFQDISTVNTVRINAGGQAFAASGSRQFDADQYYAGIDRTSSILTGDILNTTDDDLYRSGRCSPSFSYNIPVANGKVNVILHFAETYFGTPGNKGGAGSRQFNVTIENNRKLTNFDIFAAAGGAMRAVQKSIPVTITDGMLNIDFTSGAADLPRISAIEVVVASQTYKVVADSYIRDGGYSAANYGYLPELDVKNVAGGDASTKRSAYVRFQLPQTVNVGSAKLRIYGHNHENSKDIYLHAYGVDDDNWTENGISKNNAPAASTASLGYVAVNDQYKYYEIDVTSYVKAQQKSGNDLLTLLLADPNNRNTRLVFNSKENSANPPQLIIQPASVSNSSARISNEEVTEITRTEQESVIYPNPVKEQFTVSLSKQHVGPVSFELVSSAGKSYSVRTAESARAGEKAEVNISGLTLSTGIYMLKIQSNAFTEVIKMLVTE